MIEANALWGKIDRFVSGEEHNLTPPRCSNLIEYALSLVMTSLVFFKTR
jgi:hypothetical protein